jgi:CheY-like chemotaxis protein
MSGDIVSLRILTVVAASKERELLRQGAAAVSVPIDILEADNATVARRQLADGDIDIVFLDFSLAATDRAEVISAARSAKPAPFIIFIAANRNEAGALANGAGVDGAVVRPIHLAEAKSLFERAVRARLPSRVLVVDDSPTTRSIVRKILSVSRFRIEIAEAQEGIEALKLIRTRNFDLVILDYNMPGLNGVETLSEIKRQYPRVGVVMMTSTLNEEIAEKARTAGAAAFLKKPFYPSDIDAVLYSVFGLRETPR